MSSRWTPPAVAVAPSRREPPQVGAKHCALFRRCPVCSQRVRICRGRIEPHQRVVAYQGSNAQWECSGSRRLTMRLVDLVLFLGPELAEAPLPVERRQCPTCKQAVEIYDGCFAHHGWQGRPCWKAGRRDQGHAFAHVVAPLTAALVGGTLATSADEIIDRMKTSRYAVLRQCPPRWGMKESHAELTTDELGELIRLSRPHCKPITQGWLQNRRPDDAIPNAIAVAGWALECPVKLTGGLNETKLVDGQRVIDRNLKGNAGGRFLDALPFARRARRDTYQSVHNADGELSGTYSGDHVTKIFARLRTAGMAVRELRKEDRPITSWAEGAAGPWDSTGKTFKRRYTTSITRITRKAYREVENNRLLQDWVRAVKVVLDTTHKYLWAKTEAVRRNRRWLTFAESIQEPDEQRAITQARQIARKYSDNSRAPISNRHHLINDSKSKRLSSGTSSAPLTGSSASLDDRPKGSGSDATGPPRPNARARRALGKGESASGEPPKSRPVLSQRETLRLIISAHEDTANDDE